MPSVYFRSGLVLPDLTPEDNRTLSRDAAFSGDGCAIISHGQVGCVNALHDDSVLRIPIAKNN